MNYTFSSQHEIIPDDLFAGKENVTEGILGRDTTAIVKVNGKMGRGGDGSDTLWESWRVPKEVLFA